MILAADIGGTYTRLQVSHTNGLVARERYKNQDYPDLIAILTTFLLQHHIDKTSIGSACFGVAGPITSNTIKLTNLAWVVDTNAIKNYLKLDKLQLINDFTAIGYGLATLLPQELLTLQPGKPAGLGAKAFIGAGTGLGAGFITYDDSNKYVVNPSEYGHSDFAPTTAQQLALWQYLSKKYPHVSLERVLSGSGLVNIYDFVIARSGSLPTINNLDSADCTAGRQPHSIDAAVITQLALEQQDELAKQALELFWQIYGAIAGNLALTILPSGGLYLAGGMIAKLAEQIPINSFLASFNYKGRMSGLLSTIPLYVVLSEHVGLQGAAICAKNIDR